MAGGEFTRSTPVWSKRKVANRRPGGNPLFRQQRCVVGRQNLREQHLVTSYLIKQLSCFNITPGINGPYTVKAGNLAHLRTDLSFCIPDKSKAGTLLNAFHPTPAVSGLPKNEACQFIQDNEGYDRRYYSGFLGMLDTNGETGIYVNLRCMQIEKNRLLCLPAEACSPLLLWMTNGKRQSIS